MKSQIKVLLVAVVATFSVISTSSAQTKFFTREAKVRFHSKAALEDITALNKKATSVLDTETGQIEFSILMKAFEFEKALMMEHFNENYVESTKYPKAVFKGVIDNNKDVDWKKDGTYPVKVSGTMNLHGETKAINASGSILIKGGIISAHSDFNLTLADFKIEIPKVVKDKVAEVVNITVDATYDPLK